MPHVSTTIMLAAAVVLVALGFAGGVLWATQKTAHRNPEERIADFYATEVAVHVSAHAARKAIMEGDSPFVLVDLRSPQEYAAGHITGAVNIPAYTNPDTPAYDEAERIIQAFRELKESNPAKDIVVYCYSAACMTGRKVGALLAENGIFVKHLTVGWQEWRYYWDLWNHDGETGVEQKWFITTGSEPGTYQGPQPSIWGGCSAEGNDFGC